MQTTSFDQLSSMVCRGPGQGMAPVRTKKCRGIRKPISCTECRRRKIKCDRQQPCQSCVKRTVPEQCVYTHGKVSSSSRPRASSSRITSNNYSSTTTTTNGHHTCSTPTSSSSLDRSHSLTSPTSHEFGSSQMSPSYLPTQPPSYYAGGTNGLYLPTEPMDTSSPRHMDSFYYPAAIPSAPLISTQQSYQWESSATPNSTSTQFPSMEQQSEMLLSPWKRSYSAPESGGCLDVGTARLRALLPDKGVGQFILNNFFRVFSPLINLVHERSLMAEFDQLYIIHKQNEVPTSFVALVYVIMALGVESLDEADPNLFMAKVHTNASSAEELSGLYIGMARQCLATENMMDEISFTTLQAHIFLCWATFNTTSGTTSDSWQMLEICVQLGVILGCNDDAPKNPYLSPLQVELRRRSWATILLMDITHSTFLERPSYIEEKKMEKFMPRQMDELDGPASDNYATKSTYFIHLYDIFLKLHKATSYPVSTTVSSNIEHLDYTIMNGLRTWDAINTPHNIVPNHDVHKLMLKMQFYHALLIIHRPYVYTTKASHKRSLEASVELIKHFERFTREPMYKQYEWFVRSWAMRQCYEAASFIGSQAVQASSTSTSSKSTNFIHWIRYALTAMSTVATPTMDGVQKFIRDLEATCGILEYGPGPEAAYCSDIQEPAKAVPQVAFQPPQNSMYEHSQFDSYSWNTAPLMGTDMLKKAYCHVTT
uniref:ARAD1D08448p n=1 Tax=Blastobotrys adeninivorans TaxID=409370 RepID=A0A060TDM9_BLAAD